MEESAPKRRRTSPSTSHNVGASEQEPASPRRRRPSYASPTMASMSRNNPEAFERARSRSRSRSPVKLPTNRRSSAFTFDSPSEALAARLATSRIVSDAPTPTRPEDGSLRRVSGGMASAARRSPSKPGSRPAPVEDEGFNPFKRGGLRRSPPAGVPQVAAPAPAPEAEDFNPFKRGGLRRSPPAGVRMDIDAPPASMPEPQLPPAVQASSPPAPPASMPEPRIGPPTDEPMVEPQHESPVPSDEPAPPEELSIARSTSPVASPSPARSFSSLNIQLPPRSSSEVRSPSPAQSSPIQNPAPEQQAEPESEGQPEPQSEPSSEPVSEPVSEPESVPEPAPERQRDSPSPPPPLPEFSPSPPPASMPPPKLPPLSQSNPQNKAPPASQPVPRLPPPDNGPRKSFQNSPVRFRELSQQRDSPLARPPSRLFEKPRKTFNQATSATQQRKPAPPTETGPRQPRPFDPNADKKKERERIQKEIESLQKDLQVAQRENERIRVMQESGRTLAPTDQDEVIDLIQRHLMDGGAEQGQTATKQLLHAALNPTAMLPFGKTIAPAPSAPVEDKLAYIKSHYPVPMTADEELPYLQLFTPFTASSTISILQQTDDEPFRQRHSIVLRSREIPGIFTAKVEMIVNPLELSVLDLNVTVLEPVAKPELGPFIEKICTGDCNRSMQRNVGILSWAMGEWLRIAVERAGFWCQLEQTLGAKDGVSEVTRQMRTRKPRRRKDDDGDEDMDETTRIESVKKADLIRYMGQQHFDLSIPYNDAEESGATIRLNWVVDFDWTGEAQNKLSVLVGAPGKWHQTDERGVLGKIPKLFAELVHGQGDTETAVRTIVALIAGEQS
ncbi:hypothetical protein NW752_009229 [Fusarium irregulare]|uniref:Uncharacterized protein n=1 Tax=Fusarium irregulare TaxID=2494466 RepID=A0A9W8PL76_9HYPO|nr:hypothetical protein NW766_008762 [Fusarium irregulare]KAJ4010052.1 hypothetical protein NW752_009229 [Fusarium irregulare]